MEIIGCWAENASAMHQCLEKGEIFDAPESETLSDGTAGGIEEGAIGKKDIRAIIEEAFPGAIITEIEKEKYRGKKVYEVDFKHDGKKLEAIISLEGEIIKVGTDD